MKYKTTKSEILRNYDRSLIINIPYCDAQYLLKNHSARAYTSGGCGWNFDLYEIDGFAICTGYRGFVKGLDYDAKMLEKYNKKAREIWEKPCEKDAKTGTYEKSYKNKMAKIERLLKRFLDEIEKIRANAK